MKHKKPKANIDGWLQTDEQQFVKKMSDTEFRVYDEIVYGKDNEHTDIFYGTIDITEYRDDELNDYIRGYYNNLSELKEIYGSDWGMIVAEIIAEQSEHDYRLNDFDG